MQKQEIFATASVFVFLLVGIAAAQVTTGSITGTVRDSTGAVIPGATVTLKNVETGVVRKLTTDASGYYSAPQLGLGNYETSAEAAGFQTLVRTGIELTVGREATVDFSLPVGTVAEQITVTGEAPLVESTNATVSSLISEKTLRDTPLSGRNFTDLASLQPGVISNLGMAGQGVYQGSTGRIVINGSRPQQSLYLLDGIEISYLYTNTAPGSVLGNTLGVDTIQEFNVLQANYGAQYGRAVGGIVNAVTRSGTNSLHGTAFEFLRNSALDAKNFFDRADGPIPPFKQNQFGGSAGGPIVKDKLFFFGSYEGLRQRLGTSDVGFTLSPETQLGQITGCPAPLRNCSPSQRIITRTVTVDPDIKVLFRLLPPPGGGDFHQMGDYYNQGLQQFLGSRTSAGTENYYMGRIDEHPSNNDSIFGRIVFDYSNTQLPDTQLFPDGRGRHTTTNAKGNYQFDTLAWTRILSATLLNTARFGFTRNNNYQCQCLQGTTGGFGVDNLDMVLDASKLPPIPSQFQIVPGVPFGGRLGIPGVFLPGGHNGPGASEVGGSLNDPLRLTDNTYTYDDSLLLTKGRHSLAIGGDVQRYQENAVQGIWASGNTVWSTIQNFLTAGTCDSGCTGFPGINVITTTGVTGPPDGYRGYRQTYGSFYVQDDFRMKSNLTVNLGIRWERISGPVEVNGKAATFKNIISDANWTQLGHEPLFASPAGFLKGFTPRLGLAYRLDQMTAIRAGAGFFQEMPLQYAWSLTPFYPPYSDRLNVRNATQWPNPLAGVDPNSPAVLAARQPIPVDPHLKAPYVMQYNLGVERQIGQNWVARVAFVGTRGVSLFVVNNPLQPKPQLDANGVPFTPRGAPGINPFLDSTRYYSNPGDSRYSALQLRLERRFSNGLQFSGSYTWANNVGDGALGLDGGQIPSTGGGFLYGNAWDYKHYDKGRLQQDVRQNFIFNYNYELPVGKGKKFGSNMAGVADQILGGWQVNGVVTARTGLPIEITGGGYNPTQYCRTCTIRPNLNPGASNSPVLGDPSLYFDTSVFSVVTPGYFGNLGRNTLNGPKLVNVDFSLFKNFAIGEKKRLQFRGEFFNILNHPSFRAPSSTVFNTDGTRSPTAGQITLTTNTSRQIQLALKFEF